MGKANRKWLWWMFITATYLAAALAYFIVPLGSRWRNTLLRSPLFAPDAILNVGISEWRYKSLAVQRVTRLMAHHSSMRSEFATRLVADLEGAAIGNCTPVSKASSLPWTPLRRWTDNGFTEAAPTTTTDSP